MAAAANFSSTSVNTGASPAQNNGLAKSTMRSGSNQKAVDAGSKQSPGGSDGISRCESSRFISLPQTTQCMHIHHTLISTTFGSSTAAFHIPCSLANHSCARRPTAQKVWGSNPNITQHRGSMIPQQNGNTTQSRAASVIRPGVAQKEVGVTDKQAHERLVYLFGASIVNNSRQQPL